MQKLSAVVIALNEEGSIGDCLQSLQFCDEIIVVDSGSTDATKEICDQHGAIVIEQQWLGFGPQKQFAVDKANYDWVLCLDADELISEALREEITTTLISPAEQAYRMPRCNRFLGRSLRHGEGYPDRNLRLFHKSTSSWSNDLVHEKVEAKCVVGELNNDIVHNSAESLEKYLATQNSYTTIQAQILFHAGKRASLSRLLLSPLIRFIKFYIFKLGFLDGLPGLIHISIGCNNSFVKYSKLIELQNNTKSNP